MKLKLAFFGAALLMVAPVWAINKCTGPDGKVAFQDAPCAGKGEKIEVRPASGGAPTAIPAGPASIAPALSATPPTAPVLPSQPAATPPPVAAKSPLAREADMCMAWYKPKLRDPAGAYYTEPSKDGRVLSITIHATNGYGGYVTRRGSCEFLNGKLDQGWTVIHAKRDEW